MLKQLRSRKAMKSVMFWTLVLTIPSFVFFYGWQSSQNQQQQEAAAVGYIKDKWFGLRERPITPFEREMASDELENRYYMFFQGMGMQPRPEEVRSLIHPEDVAREAIDEYLFIHNAEKKGVDVSQQEVVQYMRRLFAGRSPDEIRKYLESQRLSEDAFAARLAHDRLLAKARMLVTSRAKASLFELWQEYLVGNEKIRVQSVRIPVIDFEQKVEVTTDSLESFYTNNAENYRIGDRVALRYVAVFRSDVEDEIDPTTDTVRAYYEKNPDLFERDKSVRVRHIFLGARADDPTTHVEAQEAKIEDLAAQIKAGADFAELANQYSEDTGNIDPANENQKRGGVIQSPISASSRSVFGEEFKRVALTLAEGEISSPVLGSLGYHLIKADTVTTAGVPAFEEVQDTARRLCVQKMTDDEFTSRGEALRSLFSESSFSTLDAFAEAANLPTTTTELIDLERNPFIPRIGSLREHLELIKDLGVGEFTEGVLKTRTAYCVLEMHRKEPSHIPPMEEVADAVRDDYITSVSTSLARDAAMDLRAKARDLGSPQDVPSSPALVHEMRLNNLKREVEARGLELVRSDPFTRSEPQAFMRDLDPDFDRNTLRLEVGDIYVTTQGDPEEPIAYVVWYFESREEPTREEFRKALPQIRSEYLAQVQQALVKEWLFDMRRKTTARINPAFLKSENSEDEDEG